MKWIEYHSEAGEIWEVLKKDSDARKVESDEISKSGKYAVYRKEMTTTDLFQVCIIPAARVDDVTGKTGREKEFYIKLELLNDEWFAISNRAFSKEEALKLVHYFTGLSKSQAERVWKAKKLGEHNTFRLEQ